MPRLEHKLLILDLDGVLIDSREMHFHTLNEALKTIDEQYVITVEEHLSLYDGLSTTRKLQMLTERKGLPESTHNTVWVKKQEATIEWFKKLPQDNELIQIIRDLKSTGIHIAVASNSIRPTVHECLTALGIWGMIEYFVSNQDVSKPKPFPEMYWQCMIHFGVSSRDTVIVEDSHIGRAGAIDSGARLFPVKNSSDFKSKKNELMQFIKDGEMRTVKWIDKKMNVLIPMAGAGSRFTQAGYTFPKPLIDVNGKPMIQVVVDNLNVDAHFIFIVQAEHYKKYNLQSMLNLIAPGCDVVVIDGITEGAACTTLKADLLIDNDSPLLIANSDQYIEWNSNEALYAFNADGVDAGILTFKSTHPKWSYALLDPLTGLVGEVAEKNPISDNATVGVYFWKHGSDYVKYAKSMIAKDIRVNNEFYVCPVFNEAIADGIKVRVKEIDRMWGIGTPEDLNTFLQHHKE